MTRPLSIEPHASTATGPQWRRGSLRVWVLISTAWILFIAAIFARDVVAPTVPGQVFYVTDTAMKQYAKDSREALHFLHAAKEGLYDTAAVTDVDTILILEPPPTQQRVARELVFADDPSHKVLSDHTATRGRLVARASAIARSEYELAKERARSAYLTSAAILAVVPPMLLLCIGMAVAWAVRGFTRT
jgi:hypothetical protein